MARSKILFIFILLSSGILHAQPGTKFWVQFKDKNATPYSLSNPTAYLSPAAVQRRQMYGIAVDSTDLPVISSYIQNVDNVSGVTVLYASRWMNAVAVSVTNTTALNTIQSFTFVKSYSPVNAFRLKKEKLVDTVFFSDATRLQLLPNYYGYAYWQQKMMNVDCLHNDGYRGQGMKIAVMDAGFYNANNLKVFDSLFARGGVLGTRDFVTGGTSVYEDDSHGTSVLSCMAALWPNVMVGTAPRADFWLFRTEDVGSETPIEEHNWIRAIEFADSAGCDIATTSLGYTTFDNPAQNHTYAQLNGKTVPMSIAATMAARKGMIVLNSAGNEGNSPWNYISVPADADSIIAVGAVDSLKNPAFFTSKGPTSDGRIKPDLSARGQNAAVAYASSNSIVYSNGTSFSCPILAGAVTCYWQKNKTLHPQTIIQNLKSNASMASAPNNTVGWGVPNMCPPLSVSEAPAENFKPIIFPVPASNKITIDSPEDFAEILLTDINGKQLLTKELSAKGQHVVFLNTLRAGIYFIHYRGKKISSVHKIILISSASHAD